MFKLLRHIRWLAILVVFGTTAQLSGQNTETLHPTSEQLIDSLAEALDYTSTHKEWTLRDFSQQQTQKKSSQGYSPGISLGLGSFFKYVIYVLIILAVIFLLVLVIRGHPSADQAIDTQFNTIETEEDLINYDAQQAYNDALENGNYRLALRMQFIQVLQYLAENKLIQWKLDKTNRDYTRELRGQKDHDHFRVLSAAFEQVWYGNKSLTEQEFHQYDAHFAHYLKRVE